MNKYIVPSQRLNIFVKVAIITFICFCIATIIGQQFEYNSLCESEDSISDHISSLKADIEELEDMINQPYDDEYVKKVARKSLGYHMPEEIIYYNDLAK